MAERTHIPSSPACGHWETLLADALDGLLTPEDEATFTSHMAACPACTALFEESRRAASGWSFSPRSRKSPPAWLTGSWPTPAPGTLGLRSRGWQATAGDAAFRPGNAPASWARAPLCRAAPDDDRGHGLLFHRPHVEHDRRAPDPCASLTCGRPRCARSWSGS